MLIAQDRLLPLRGPQTPIGKALAIAISAALHAAVVGILLLRPGRTLPPAVPPLEIEMVQQSAEVRGAPPPPATAAAAETSPSAAVPPSPAAPPLATKAQDPAPSAAVPPSAPAAQARKPTPTQRAAPEVNLGNAAEDLDPLIVTGDNVVPPGPDSRYRNLPPHYPAAAARIGAEGTVQVVARVAANGLPLSVSVVGSSGNTDLDEEAKRAVSLWRFRPAREGGRAIPYDYVVNIRFALGDR